MPTRDTTVRSGGFIFFPAFNPIWKLTVTHSSGTDDITDLITSCEVEDGVNEVIGRFEFEISDAGDVYRTKWANMDTVLFYGDNGATASTLRFRGRIEKISFQGFKLKVSGRAESLKFVDITVTRSFENIECSSILTSIINSYRPDSTYTTTNINTSTTNLTVNWRQKPFWDCLNELGIASGFDFYLDANKDFHFFQSGTRNNDNEAIVHDQNLLEIIDFADDASLVKNRIIIYGAEIDGIQIIYTAEDSASQTTYGIREEIINDNNIINYTQAKELGDFLLENNKNPPQVGEVKGTLCVTIQPGENMTLSSPYDNIIPGYYNITSYKHLVGSLIWETTVKISKEPRKTSHILKTMIENMNKGKETSSNPNEMRHSYDFLFDSDEGTHSFTEISGGVLKPTSTAGTWTSPTRTHSSTITQAYLIVVGEILSGATVRVSADNGDNYQTITNKNLINFTNTGTQLKIQVLFTNSNSLVDSLQVQYK